MTKGQYEKAHEEAKRLGKQEGELRLEITKFRKENLSAEQKADKAAKESDRATKENRETSEKLRAVTAELTELKKQLQVIFGQFGRNPDYWNQPLFAEL